MREARIWRYTPSSEKWEDITRNLDLRGWTGGVCCIPTPDIHSFVNATYVYANISRGLYRWDYKNDNWEKLYVGPYGQGPAKMGHIVPIELSHLIRDI